MKTLCEILDVITNPSIMALAVIEFVVMCIAIGVLVNFRHRINKLNKQDFKKRKVSKASKGKTKAVVEMENDKDWYEFDQFLEDYQRKGWCYSAFSSIIQIFTLLGILGTVAGLFLAMANGEDMYRGVELALSTTVLGIMFAVIYKLLDIFITAFLIDYIEDGISRFEKTYSVDKEDAAMDSDCV